MLKIRFLFLSIFLGGIQFAFSQSKIACDSIINLAVENIFSQEKYTSAIIKLQEVKEVAEKQHFQKQNFLATNNIGVAYYQMLDYGNAIQYYLEAYQIAIENEDIFNEMSVLNNIAIVYASEENLEKAQEYFKKSFDIAQDIDNTSRIGLYASNLAKINFELNQIQKAKSYIEIALANSSSKASEINALITEIHIYFQEGKFEKVITQANLVLEETKKYKLFESTSELQVILAKTYLQTEDFEKASQIIQSGIKKAANNKYKVEFYEQKSLLALKTNNIEDIFKAKDSIVKLKDFIYSAKNQEILENSKLKFELAASNHDLEINKEKSTNQRLIYILITVSLIFILLSLLWAFYKRNQANKNKRELIERNLQIADLELEKEKQKTAILNQEYKEKELRNELEKKKLTHEIEQQNKKLSDKILFQSTRNEMIEEIINKISELPQINENKSQAYINKLKFHLKEDTKWEEFSANFQNVNNEFLAKLKELHPNLNANDIRFLSFIYLNLSNKEIASLLNITPNTCRKRKERLSKKMGLPSGKKLFEYLSSL